MPLLNAVVNFNSSAFWAEVITTARGSCTAPGHYLVAERLWTPPGLRVAVNSRLYRTLGLTQMDRQDRLVRTVPNPILCYLLGHWKDKPVHGDYNGWRSSFLMMDIVGPSLGSVQFVSFCFPVVETVAILSKVMNRQSIELKFPQSWKEYSHILCSMGHMSVMSGASHYCLDDKSHSPTALALIEISPAIIVQSVTQFSTDCRVSKRCHVVIFFNEILVKSNGLFDLRKTPVVKIVRTTFLIFCVNPQEAITSPTSVCLDLDPICGGDGRRTLLIHNTAKTEAKLDVSEASRNDDVAQTSSIQHFAKKKDFNENDQPPLSQKDFSENDHSPLSQKDFSKNDDPSLSQKDFNENDQPPLSQKDFSENDHSPLSQKDFSENDHSPPSQKDFTKNDHPHCLRKISVKMTTPHCLRKISL
ncbi:hypothetical protein RRG08_040814 [Elysia crispata]|uniref:Uncharacterized protein n=1 Tax=Elysia crispata TaxID=231223 RepID=A0AAE0Z916_9GAST|nr:hypothetical protein RRG08_040814 [Elysia crispata]